MKLSRKFPLIKRPDGGPDRDISHIVAHLFQIVIRLIVLLRQLSYAIKNQLKAPKDPSF